MNPTALAVSPERKLFLHIKKVENPPDDEIPQYSIYSKNNILYCTGNSALAATNNRAAELMKDGFSKKAVSLLEKGLDRAPLFFPFQYNLGISYINLGDLKTAEVHLTKALHLVPEYSKTYLQIGYIYDRLGIDEKAMQFFRDALKKNSKELEAIILIGNIYFKRNQITLAEKYYVRALAINSRFPDGLLGKAKIHFYRREYFKAIIQIKSIDTSGDYDKALHFYYAESAYKLRDYQTAYEEYKRLLTFRNDRFFLENAVSLIEHKMKLSRRFIDHYNY